MNRLITLRGVCTGIYFLLFIFFAHATKLPAMNTWTYPYPTHKIILNDSLTINYVDEGKGSHTLLFIHGLGSNLKAWQKNIEGLKGRYRCIAMDLPNYGQSSTGQYPFSMSFFAETIHLFIQKLKLKKVVLVGHSMGGQAAIHFALQYPSSLSHLVLLAPAGFERFTPQQVSWFEQVYTAAFVKSATENQIIKNFQLNFYDMPEDAQFMISDRLQMRADSLAYDQYCSMIPQCVLGMLKEPVFDRLKEVKSPTLVFFGEADRLIPNPLLNAKLTTTDVAQKGVDQLPNAKLVMVPKAGHFVQWEGANSVHSTIHSFLEKN